MNIKRLNDMIKNYNKSTHSKQSKSHKSVSNDPKEPIHDEESDLNEPDDKVILSSHMNTSKLTRDLKLNNLGLDDEYFKNFEAHNIKGTLYPINGVCYFVGAKGSGKTYTLSAVVQYAFKIKEISRLIYIYADNVDSTIIRSLPKNKILSVPKEIASVFLWKFLRKKTKFTSCYNLLRSAKNLKIDVDSPKANVSIKNTDLYIDNLLEQLASRKKLNKVVDILKYADKTIRKYKRGTIIRIDDFVYDLGTFDINQYDMITIDDIGQFLDIFGSTRKGSELYKYFTITRQNKTAIYLTGQEIRQLPKMMREMLGAVVMLNGTNFSEMSELKIPSNFQKIFYTFASKMQKYEGILYNFNDKEYELIRYH